MTTEIERDGFSQREMYLMRQAWEARKYAAADETLDGWLDEIISDAGHYVAQHLAHDAERLYGSGSSAPARCSECGPVDDGTALYCVKCWESAGSGEAVAFQFGQDHRYIANHWPPENIQDPTVRPLYTHPSTSVPEGFREQLEDLVISAFHDTNPDDSGMTTDDCIAGVNRLMSMLTAAPQPVGDGLVQVEPALLEIGPTEYQLYCADTKEQFVGYHNGKGLFTHGAYKDSVTSIQLQCRPTHYKPLPKPPEGE